MKGLLSPLAYEHVFEPYRGKSAFLACPPGNWGDMLISEATRQLFRHFGIQEVAIEEAEVIMHSGGGNMGPLYGICSTFREKLRQSAKDRPVVVLPQSWTGPDAFPAAKFFARETASLQYCPQAILAPDLALAYEMPATVPSATPNFPRGVFFRRDKEKTKVPDDNQGDPVSMSETLNAYLHLASDYECIHTNRLHFAVAALLAGRRVILYANSYHKNRGVFELWLRGRGCEWGE